jgi:hypothetical protein
MARLTISLTQTPAMWAHRVSLGKLRLVYVITADRLLSYPTGRSRIAYIGTTKNGPARIAQSVAHRAEVILRLRGVSEMTVRILTCAPRQHVKTWHKLERALLLQFKDDYGSVPVCNTQGKNMVWRDEGDHFTASRLSGVLDRLR